MTTHQCSFSLQCKSKTCSHAKLHKPNGCDCQAPCGCWPNDSNFQPTVICIPKEEVKPRADCPHCGAKELVGHHFMDCINNLKRQLKIAKEQNIAWKSFK